jgi:hypothetical protein
LASDARRAGAESQLELEAGLGVVEGGAEQLAEASDPVADGLRVDIEGGGGGGDRAHLGEPDGEGRGEARAAGVGLGVERREGASRQAREQA